MLSITGTKNLVPGLEYQQMFCENLLLIVMLIHNVFISVPNIVSFIVQFICSIKYIIWSYVILGQHSLHILMFLL